MRDRGSCPLCGTRAFSWGRPIGNNRVAFLQEGIVVGYDVVVRRCDSCGNIQYFTDVPPLSNRGSKPKRKRKPKRDE